MTNAPESRKTHITRICFRNKAGERVDGKSIDVERIDVIKSAFQIPPDFQWQGLQRKLLWCDNPDDDNYSPTGTPSRLTEIVKVCDAEAEDDVNDPEEYAEVRVIKGMKSSGGGSESMGQGFMDRFVNAVLDDGPNTARISEVRKIPHYDTNIDDAAEAAFDADPGRREYVVPGEFYQKDLSTKDDSQAVDHEIITYIKHKGNSEQVAGIGRQTRLRNEYLIDESDPPSGDAIGVSGINPPYRLDPFQNIVNVQFNPVGAVFVIGTHDGYIWSSVMKNKNATPTFRRVGVIGDVENVEDNKAPGQWFGGSYALVNNETPTFVLGGVHLRWVSRGGPALSPFDVGKIMVSHDGETWTTAFVQDDGYDGARRDVTRLVWDEDEEAFFAEMFWTQEFIPLTDPNTGSECWKSRDGRNWSLINHVEYPFAYVGSLVNAVYESHCKLKDTASRYDGNGGLSDSRFGLDKSKKSLIKTYPLGRVVDANGVPGGTPPVGLLIKDSDISLFFYQAIAFAGGIWGKSDFSTDTNDFSVSIDGGATWQDVGKLPQLHSPSSAADSATAIIAGNYKDVFR